MTLWHCGDRDEDMFWLNWTGLDWSCRCPKGETSRWRCVRREMWGQLWNVGMLWHCCGICHLLWGWSARAGRVEAEKKKNILKRPSQCVHCSTGTVLKDCILYGSSENSRTPDTIFSPSVMFSNYFDTFNIDCHHSYLTTFIDRLVLYIFKFHIHICTFFRGSCKYAYVLLSLPEYIVDLYFCIWSHKVFTKSG